MNRRGFLQLLAATATSVVVPVPRFILAEPLVVMPSMPIVLGAIRAIVAYDLYLDDYIVRLDAFNGCDQFGIDFRVCDLGHGMRDSYLRARTLAEGVLYDALIEAKWNAGDMIALPPLEYFPEPEWMRS